MESVLFTFIQTNQAVIVARRGRFTFDPEHSLQNYLSIFNRWFRREFPNLELADLIVEHRDLVHFNREVNLPVGQCRRAAVALLRTLDALLRELNSFGCPIEHGENGAD
jgi:hypothetical protein